MTDTNRGALACFEDAISLAGNHDNTGLDAELRTARDRVAELLAAVIESRGATQALRVNGTAAQWARYEASETRIKAATRACRGEP